MNKQHQQNGRHLLKMLNQVFWRNCSDPQLKKEISHEFHNCILPLPQIIMINIQMRLCLREMIDAHHCIHQLLEQGGGSMGMVFFSKIKCCLKTLLLELFCKEWASKSCLLDNLEQNAAVEKNWFYNVQSKLFRFTVASLSKRTNNNMFSISPLKKGLYSFISSKLNKKA